MHFTIYTIRIINDNPNEIRSACFFLFHSPLSRSFTLLDSFESNIAGSYTHIPQTMRNMFSFKLHVFLRSHKNNSKIKIEYLFLFGGEFIVQQSYWQMVLSWGTKTDICTLTYRNRERERYVLKCWSKPLMIVINLKLIEQRQFNGMNIILNTLYVYQH